MHPAYSVILFTTASGAGYGLLFWLAVLAIFDDLPATSTLGLAGFGIAFALVAVGLLSSTAHLGRPERAWRAFSQWRTSWLSREGIAAVATFVPMAVYAYGWIILGTNRGLFALVGFLLAAMCLVTVWCTGMIYQSLPTIRAWNQTIVSPVYVAMSLSSGAVLALCLLKAFGLDIEDFGWVTVALVAVTLLMKRVYWAYIDQKPEQSLTAGDATGLGRFGTVRPLEAPHSQANFVMREMGYAVGRKHANKLRLLVQVVGFVLPLVLLVAMLTIGGVVSLPLTIVAMLALAFGVIVERWLFFAEAQHVVTLYYGAQTA
jgi:sulfite dehydrogenase (quinone) subunit SoeC